jgi:uncharacterized membrane protein YqaE (UPF0057 family)
VILSRERIDHDGPQLARQSPNFLIKAILLPPVAMLLCGKVFQAIMALILQLTVLGWIPASLWALFVVNSHLADVSNKQLISAIERSSRQGK